MLQINKDKLSQDCKATLADFMPVSSIKMQPKIITDIDDIIGLKDQWHALEDLSPNTVFFQSFDWCNHFLDFQKCNPAFKPVILTVYAGNVLVCLLPLTVQNKGSLSVLTGLCEPFQQYSEILLSPNFDFEVIKTAFIRGLNQIGADYVHLGQVREDGALARLLDGVVPATGERDGAPYVVLNGFENFESYRKTIRQKTRKNLRNARNRLERDAPVRHEIMKTGPAMQTLVDRVYEGREAWLERLGITSRAFRDADFKRFLDRFADNDIQHNIDVVGMSLYHGKEAISDQWGFVYHGRYYAFMATWNTDYEPYSPGRLHLGEVIKTGFAQGYEVVDFMIPASNYKKTYTTNVAPVSDYVLGLSLKGKLYAKLWLGFARPLSKKLFFSLPVGLRGLLVKKALPIVE